MLASPTTVKQSITYKELKWSRTSVMMGKWSKNSLKSLQPLQPSKEIGMSTPGISCPLQRVCRGPFRLPYLAMKANAGSHLLCSLLSRHRRAGLSATLQRCSRALPSGCSVCLLVCSAQMVSASLITSCRPKVIAAVKSNYVSSHSLWFCCCSIAFLLPLDFLYFILAVSQSKNDGNACL